MIRLHHAHGTRSMRTLWLLEELGLAYELVVHPFDKSLRSSDYWALNPAGRVPALELDEAVLFETGAITELLCERFSPDGLGRMPGHPERADWLIYLHFSETISQHTAALTQQHIALYEDWMRSPTVMKLEAKRLEKCYKVLENRLSERDYLLEGGFAACDISCAQAIYMAQHFALIEPFANLNAWYLRCTSRTAFAECLPPAQESLYRAAFYPPPDA